MHQAIEKIAIQLGRAFRDAGGIILGFTLRKAEEDGEIEPSLRPDGGNNFRPEARSGCRIATVAVITKIGSAPKELVDQIAMSDMQ